MGDLVAWRPKPDRAEITARVGMLVCLAAWSMMFASLFFTYSFVRAQAAVWPPPGTVALSRAPAIAATAMLVGAVTCFELARWAIRARRSKAMILALLVGAAVGVLASLGLQVSEILEGRRLRMSGSFGSLFMTMLFFHAVILAAGLPSFAVLLARARQGLYSPQRHIGVRVWGMYWKYATAVRLLLFIVLYAI